MLLAMTEELDCVIAHVRVYLTNERIVIIKKRLVLKRRFVTMLLSITILNRHRP